MKNFLLSIFNKYPNLTVALSEKQDGPMRFSGDPSRDRAVIKNRKIFLNKLGIDINSVVSANLVHGSAVQIVTTQDKGKIIVKTDGLLTNAKNIFLSITIADCLPIFLYDYEKEIIGLIHGGWRGLSQNILSSAIEKLKDDFASNPKTILAGIGPGISQCHYEVKEDVLTKFKQFSSDVFTKRDGKTFLDLKKIATVQLINLGIEKENIEINSHCVYCLSDKYFSYRRDKLDILETMIAVIGMK